jgi:glycosyltransferase involved in cell wall biosynthesis
MVDNLPLKVLHICQRDDPTTGGAVRVAVEYVKRLPNCQVDAYCLFLYGLPGYFQAQLGSRAYYLGLRDSRDVVKFHRLLRFIRAFKPDIIHHHDGLLWTQLLTFYHPGTVKVAHAHIRAKRSSTLSKGLIAGWLQCQSTDLLVCITEDTRRTHIQRGQYNPKRTCVLYNGVDPEYFYPPSLEKRSNTRIQLGLPRDAPVVGFVGRLDCEVKGTDDFLKVIARLPSYVWGLVVGSGPDADRLKALAHDLGIANRTVFTGTLDSPTLAYHTMTTFCFTSNWDSFGLVVAEAMACQLPVVGFACEGGVNELLTPETGIVIPNRDIEAMAQAVQSTIEVPENQSQHQANATKRISQHHNWDTNTLALAKIYQQTLGICS